MVLKSVAGIIKRCVTETDIVGRYGGEEFIIVLPQKDAAEAQGIAEIIRQSVEKKGFELRHENKHVTVSLGFAEFPRDAGDKDELVWKADQLLYEAKKQGRNRVCGNI
jgi:diguanylate cyclase (GGDEF)-like protein